jgi:hypothetical protein
MVRGRNSFVAGFVASGSAHVPTWDPQHSTPEDLAGSVPTRPRGGRLLKLYYAGACWHVVPALCPRQTR